MSAKKVDQARAEQAASERKLWDSVAEDYSQKVYSITKSPGKRKRVLDKVSEGARDILVMGCGSEVHLQRQLLDARPEAVVACSDLSGKMLEVAESTLRSNQLLYVAADSRALPFPTATFDHVISTNSILPSSRADVCSMFAEAARVLKPGGSLLFYLPAFEYSQGLVEKHPGILQVDAERLAVFDTASWQCFHTEESIRAELGALGLELDLTKVFLDDDIDRDEILRLYGEEIASSLWEHFVVASKPKA